MGLREQVAQAGEADVDARTVVAPPSLALTEHRSGTHFSAGHRAVIWLQKRGCSSGLTRRF